MSLASRQDFKRLSGSLLYAEIDGEYLSSSLDVLARMTDSPMTLSAYGYADAGPDENAFKIIRVTLLNGVPMKIKERVQLYSSLYGEVECASVAEATEEIVRLREVLRLQGFPQFGPTNLRVRLEACLLLSSSVDHGVQVAKSSMFVQDQIDLLQVKLKPMSDRLLKSTFSRQTKIVSRARKDLSD